MPHSGGAPGVPPGEGTSHPHLPSWSSAQLLSLGLSGVLTPLSASLMLPFPRDDWSRVPLKPLYGEPGSDYINASFVPVSLWLGSGRRQAEAGKRRAGPGCNLRVFRDQSLWSTQEFIAAQGPLAQTVGDFWRLVWEQRSSALIMLTNCVESGRVRVLLGSRVLGPEVQLATPHPRH